MQITPKLLFARWGAEFNEPVITPENIEMYCQRIAKYEFTVEQIAAGIERYAEVFEYGQRRNWATLLKCINEIQNAGLNIMPAGVAADLFVSGVWGCDDRVQKLGYDPISSDYYKATLQRLGSGIGQEKTQYARLKFIQVYDRLINYETSIEGQSAKRLSEGIRDRDRLTEGKEVWSSIKQLKESKSI